MDRIESLGNTLSQLTLYDIKSMYNQAKNVVLNISETEAKVREATNDEPWGASSTLMQEIAQGTFNFQQFNEIMPCIYGRFMEKEARQWRQIYKALQLLEYLIKHGSERVVDDARSHISTLKMLRSFHYIDEKGKDEGINVRNRAKELVELLSDVEKIRTERRKAKTNKSKYVGVGNDGGYGSSGLSFGAGGSRYGGFGSDSLGGGGGGSWGNGDYYGSGGGGSTSRVGGFSDSSSGRRQYEEYNAGDDEEIPSGRPSVNRSSSNTARPTTRKASLPTPAAAPAPVANLLDFDDDAPPSAATPAFATNKELPKPVGLDDDDFADFQAAPVQTTATTTAPAPVPASAVGQEGAKPNLMQLLNATPMSPTQNVTQQPQQQQAGAFGGMHRPAASMGGASMQQGTMFGGGGGAMRPSHIGGVSMSGGSSMVPTPMRSPVGQQAKPGGTAKGGGFDDLWNLSLASSGKAVSSPGGGNEQGKSMKDLQKEKATAGLWGGGARPNPGGMGGAGLGNIGSGGDDLLL